MSSSYTQTHDPAMLQALEKKCERQLRYVIGPNGEPLTLADLPDAANRRWVIRRKAEVVMAVRGGLLSLDDACTRYQLTLEEFISWQKSVDEYGLDGLRITHTQKYRNGSDE